MRRSFLSLVLVGCAPWAEAPGEAVLVTEDLPRYWEAIDAPGDRAENLDRLYLAPGTPGLRAMRRLRFDDAETLAATYERSRDWFEAIRENSLRLHEDPAVLDGVRAAYRAAEDDWPPAVFPPVTFVIGGFDTGGTVASAGMVIGAEFYTAPEGAPVEDLDPWRQSAVGSVDRLPSVVAHELAHVQQRELCAQGFTTLLAQSLLEGVGDWAAERWTGAHLNAPTHGWALPREAALWAEFQVDMRGEDTSGWMYEGATGDRPADLGYFVGYRVAEAWWSRHGEVPDALERVLGAHCEAEAFLEESGYDPR